MRSLTSLAARRIGVVAAAALLLAACGDNDETEPPPESDDGEVSAPEEDEPPTEDDDPLPSDDGEEPPGGVDDGDDPTDDGLDGDEPDPPEQGDDVREFDVDVSDSHPNGVVVQVSRVILTSNTIELEAEILNGSGEERILHDADNSNFYMGVVDQLENVYPFSPGSGEQSLVIAGNELLEGRLVFLGRLDPGAEAIGLIVGGGEAQRSPQSDRTDMALVIELPDQ